MCRKECAFGNHLEKRAGVVFHIQPPDVVAFAVYQEQLAFQGVQYHQWNKLFGEIIRAIIVAVVRHQCWQALGAR